MVTRIKHNHSTTNSGFAGILQKYGLIINGVMLLGAGIAFVIMLVALKDMEDKQRKDIDSLITSIYTTSEDSIYTGQIDNMFKFVPLVSKMSNVQYVAYYSEKKAEPLLQDGSKADLTEALLSFFEDEIKGVEKKKYIYFRKIYGNELGLGKNNRTMLSVVFSRDTFIAKKNIILYSACGIGLILMLLMMVVRLLQRTQKQLAESERIKSDMISAITHDANNNLFVIKGQSENLKIQIERKFDVEKMLKRADIIRSNVEPLEKMLSDLDMHEKLMQGKVAILSKLFDITDVIALEIENAHDGLREKQQSIQCEMSGDKSVVWADEIRMRQVLNNLLNNAMKYSPEQTIIYVSTTCVPAGVKVRIQDQGPGIPEKQWAELFKPFKRLAATKDSVKGTGLGLFHAKLLLELMDGEIGIEASAVGKGTTFYFVLPYAKKDMV
jgi:signal transduction histidine kinase